MATKLNAVDILIVGLGWTGGIIAKELASTKLKIVALERGGPRDTNPDFIDPQIHDELRYAARHDLMQNVRRETITFRNSESQTALLSVLEMAQFTGMNSRTIYRLISTGELHFRETAAGLLLVCFDSLSAEKEKQLSIKEKKL